MSEAEIEEFLYTQLAQRGQGPNGTGNPQVGIGGEIDSLLGLELTLAIEERYGFRLADDELISYTLRSIPRLAHVVANKLSGETRK